jgi:flavin reductase (DIM6/NTAB) family NADH-FMN oxidoreductase RutF
MASGICGADYLPVRRFVSNGIFREKRQLKIDINALPPAVQYKLLSSTIVPRPIALVTTCSRHGRQNAAPFSFFNVMGEDPPVLVLGLEEKRGSGALKHTTINIRDTGEFVVHLVDEGLAEAMNICAIDFPSDVDEATAAGLTLIPSDQIRAHRIVEAPVAFECEKIALLQISSGRNIAIGKVKTMHVREGLLDLETFYIDPNRYHPVGRMFGRLYTKTREHFEMTTPSYEEWRKRNDPAV